MRDTPVRGGGTGGAPETSEETGDEENDDTPDVDVGGVTVRETDDTQERDEQEPEADDEESQSDVEASDEPQSSRDQLRSSIGSITSGVADTTRRAAEATAEPIDQASDAVEDAADTASQAAEQVTEDEEMPDSRPQRARGEGIDIPGEDPRVDEDAARDDGGPINPRVRAMTGGDREDQLRARAALETDFREDEIAIEEEGDTLQAAPTEEAIEQQIRQDVAREEGVDQDRVEVTQDGEEFRAEVQHEAGLSGVEAIVRGEQSDRDFLRAESDRAMDVAEDVGDTIRGDDPGAVREFTGSATQTGIEFAEPAGGVLFADEVAQELDDRRAPFDPTVGTALLSIDTDDIGRAEDAGRSFGTSLQEDPVRTTGQATGAVAATLAPIGAPRAGRSASGRADSDAVRRFLDDDRAMVRLDQRTRAEGRQGEQQTITRDSPEADPSDPSPRERVDQITERIGGEGTMQRTRSSFDEAIVVEPQQRGPAQRSPEDQLPPREEFPSEAAFQRELDAVRSRDQPQQTQRATDTSRSITRAEATAAGAVATPGVDATEAAFRDVDATAGFGAASATDAASDAAADFSADFDFGVGFGAPGRQTTESTTTADTTQLQTQQTRQQRIGRTRTRSRGRSRRTELEDPAMEADRDAFGFDIGDAAFETGIADADDLFNNNG